MSDMTSVAAIDLLDNLIGMVDDNQENDYDSALHMAIDALKTQAERTEERTETHACDLIDRQSAIDALDKRFDSIPMEQTTEILLLRKDLRELPSAQPEKRTEERTETHGVCLDAIDRQAAIDALDKHLQTTDVPVSYPGIISALTEWLNEVPSAQPDSKETSPTHKALDTISRQAAIDALKEALNPSVAYFVKAKMAIEALPPSPSRPHDISKAKFSCPICSAEMEVTVDEWDEGGAV